MKRVTQRTTIALLLIAASFLPAYAQQPDQLPAAEDVVARMVERDAQRQAQAPGYTATRRYVAMNRKREAEMLVRVVCSSDGVKQFTILSEEGSGAIRKHVFYKLLKEEEEASRRGTRESTRLIPENYDFQMLRQEVLDSGPAYVLAVTPKTVNKYLIDGTIWVDARDYSIVRIEGQPAKNPSFWVHGVHFVHTYQKVQQFWLASSTHTTSEVRIFGAAELTIENSDYALDSPRPHAAEPLRAARSMR